MFLHACNQFNFEFSNTLKTINLQSQSNLFEIIACTVLEMKAKSLIIQYIARVIYNREALFLFCWAKVLGPTIFGSDNLKLLVFQQKGQNSSQHRHFYNVGSQKLLAQPFCSNNWGKGVLILSTLATNL